MRRLFLFYILLSLCFTTLAQKNARFFYEKGARVQNKAQHTPDAKRLHEESILLFNKAIKLDSSYPEAYFGKGVAYAELGDPITAIKCFDKAIELKPDYAKAFQHRGMRKAEDKIQDYSGAIKDFDTVIQLKAGSAYTYYYRGYAKSKLGMTKEACEDYKRSESLGGVGFDRFKYCQE